VNRKKILTVLITTILISGGCSVSPFTSEPAAPTIPQTTDTSASTNTPQVATTAGPVLTCDSVSTENDWLQGWAPSPLGLAVTSDRKTAYIPFSLDDSLLVIDLTTFTVRASIDVSAAGNMLFSTAAALSLDGRKLYVSNYATGNVMVVNTESNEIETVLPIQPLWGTAITMTQDGNEAYIPSEDGGLYIVNTANNSFHRVFVPGIIFGPTVLSPDDPDILYTVGALANTSGIQTSFIALRISSKKLERFAKLAVDILPPGTPIPRLILNSKGTRAYFGWLNPGDRGTGNFTVFDLESFQVLASEPMENGVADFAVDEQRGKAYIIGFWAGGGAPNQLPIMEFDLTSNQVVDDILLSPSSDQRAIAIDPTNPDYLYMTEGDWNILRKIELSTGREIRRMQFNNENIRPYVILRDKNMGYIVSNSSQRVYRLDLSSRQLLGFIDIPVPFRGAGIYQERLYGSTGDAILAVSLSDGSTLQKYPIAQSIQPILFTFFGDRMATIDFREAMIARRLILFDAKTMTVLKSIDLPSEPYGDKVIASPDGSKLYTMSGHMSGTTTKITIYDASTLEVIQTIEIPPVDQRNGATGFVEGEFDEVSRILYLTGFSSIYKIDMDNDRLIGSLDLIDLYENRGVRGWSPTGLAGVTLSASRDKLFVISGDAHSMYTYNLVESSWLAEVTDIGGYFITDSVSSVDQSHLFTANNRSDNVTVIDLTTGKVEKVIDLNVCNGN